VEERRRSLKKIILTENKILEDKDKTLELKL
jgi:hypothetical protein